MPSAPQLKTDQNTGSGSHPAPPAFQERWLIRTAQNQVSGPWSREDIRARILSGELHAQDEICKANSYWIILHEREELLAQLGIELPKQRDEEVTETETGPRKAPDNRPRFGASDRESQQETDGGTSMIFGKRGVASPSNTREQRAAQSQFPPQGHSPGNVQVLGKMEKPSLWRGLVWVLVTSALLLIYLVLRSLRTGAVQAPF